MRQQQCDTHSASAFQNFRLRSTLLALVVCLFFLAVILQIYTRGTRIGRDSPSGVLWHGKSAARKHNNNERPSSSAATSCVFVFGLESSGTKFVATHIARGIAPTEPGAFLHELLFTARSGGSATCWKGAGGSSVQHISLPSGCTCTTARYRSMIEGVDACEDEPLGRWVADVVATMRRHPACTGIVVERLQRYGHLSRASQHCDSEPLLREEEAAARRSLAPALANAREHRLLRVSYESLVNATTWQAIANHTRMAMPRAWPPAFRDGDRKWDATGTDTDPPKRGERRRRAPHVRSEQRTRFVKLW